MRRRSQSCKGVWDMAVVRASCQQHCQVLGRQCGWAALRTRGRSDVPPDTPTSAGAGAGSRGSRDFGAPGGGHLFDRIGASGPDRHRHMRGGPVPDVFSKAERSRYRTDPSAVIRVHHVVRIANLLPSPMPPRLAASMRCSSCASVESVEQPWVDVGEPPFTAPDVPTAAPCRRPGARDTPGSLPTTVHASAATSTSALGNTAFPACRNPSSQASALLSCTARLRGTRASPAGSGTPTPMPAGWRKPSRRSPADAAPARAGGVFHARKLSRYCIGGTPMRCMKARRIAAADPKPHLWATAFSGTVVSART